MDLFFLLCGGAFPVTSGSEYLPRGLDAPEKREVDGAVEANQDVARVSNSGVDDEFLRSVQLDIRLTGPALKSESSQLICVHLHVLDWRFAAVDVVHLLILPSPNTEFFVSCIADNVRV
jgi:hypothetical protein